MKRKALALTVILALLFSAVTATQFVNLGKADPYIVDFVQEGEVAPPNGTKPPTISIFSPENNSAYASNNISLNFNVSIPESNNVSLNLIELYYRPSWQKLGINVYSHLYYSYYSRPIQLSINLTSIPEGPHWLEVYAVARGEIVTRQDNNGIFFTTYYVIFKISGSSEVSFTIDTIPPKISILYVENKTYSTAAIPLNFITNERISQSTYSLDGHENVSITGNTTLTGLANGDHNLTIYSKDEAGNTGASETIYFRVEAPFPTTLVIASVIPVVVVGAGVLVYFKKRNHAKTNKHSEKAQSPS
jgi:hypothetical protein